MVASGGRPDPLPPIHGRANAALRREADPNVVPAQFSSQERPSPSPMPAAQPNVGAGLGMPEPEPAADPMPAVEFSGRNGGRPSLRSFQTPGSNEQIWVFDQGMKVVLRSDQLQQLPGTLGQTQQVILMADRAVAWTNSLSELMQGGSQLDGKRWEFYLEGNIVFSTGDRVVYAERMYYDANLKRGTILNAEVISPVDGFEGLLRIKADIIQQLDERSIRAVNAAVTSSRLGYPRYWVQSENVNITHTQTPSIDPFTGQQAFDPVSGMPINRNDYTATSRNNFVYLAGWPVFYWPSLKTDLSEPSVYLRSAGVRSDSVFGNQILTKWDAYNLLGFRDRPEGTDWTLDFDYLSDRGFALGTEYELEGQDLFGAPGTYKGFLDAWGINDRGLDNLGLGRRAVPHENELRGRVLSQFRYDLDIGWQLTTEIGYVSDRNFLEQYYEREWDQQKDTTTGIELLRLRDNRSLSFSANVRLNDFWMENESLPRLDHYILGQPILLNAFNWSAHTYGGYMHLNPAEPPTNPVDINTWTPLPGEVNAEGAVFGTRHLLEAPVQLGPFRAVPYALGDGSFYYKDVNQEDLTRLYGQAGLRLSLPFWKVDPTVCSLLWNLNGLAHKVSLDTDFFYADSSQNLDLYPRYNSPDDNAQEEFRRRFFFTTFDQILGGAIPPQFDDRGYLLRTGTQNYVTSPVPEIAEDLMVGKFAIRQRWQTKRGAPGRQRIVDWITLDVGGSYFPQADRDNFGEDFGLLEYQFRWNLGDRFSLLSDGYADLFQDGLRTASIGSIISRPENGRLYLGFRQIDGPIESQIITAAWSYRMSDTWMTTASGSYDLQETGNIGQSLNFTRIGESFLVSFG
ncbi:MAG: organic solvent tolerance protein OstA, partial [Planctomycetota bacterium]|nr:organic solvent tolerance protein OstA [Planctomycetota bacterium]